MWGRRRTDPEATAAARARLASLDVQQPRRAQLERESQQALPPSSDEDDGTASGPFGFAMERSPGDATTASTGRHAAASSALQRLAGHICDHLPMPVRGRLGVTSQHVSVIAVVLAVSLAAGSWLFLRSRPAPVSSLPRAPVVAPSVASGAATPSSSTAIVPATSTPTPSVVVVDVAGKVRNPGIVELPVGSRVVDALKAAGGARPHVNLSTLNLARLLVDGEQILVGVVGVSGVPPTLMPGTTVAATPTGLVNINTATQAQLEELPGVGPVTALAILTWRADNGSFSSVDELLEVSGIGDATLEDLRPYVTV